MWRDGLSYVQSLSYARSEGASSNKSEFLVVVCLFPLLKLRRTISFVVARGMRDSKSGNFGKNVKKGGGR